MGPAFLVVVIVDLMTTTSPKEFPGTDVLNVILIFVIDAWSQEKLS